MWEVAARCQSAYSNAKSNKKHLTDIGELNFLMCKAIDNPHLTPSSSLRTAVISVFEEPVVYESNDLHAKLGVEDYVGLARQLPSSTPLETVSWTAPVFTLRPSTRGSKSRSSWST